MIIKYKKLTDTATVPTRGSVEAAGYDLYADGNDIVVVEPHETRMIGTGIAMEIPEGYFGAIYPRSGIATGRGLRLANCVGVIDSDYRGEIGIPIHNDTNEKEPVYSGERIAQIIIQKYEPVVFEEVKELSDTERGEGGFGSTGER